MADAIRRRIPMQHSEWRNFFGQINVAFISMTYYFSQEQGTSSASSSHTLLAFVLPLLLNFLQLKYQGRELSPFETHPKSMGIAIASVLLYCLAYDAELRFSSSYACIAGRGLVLFGSVSFVSLASILFPDSLGPVLYSLYILFSAGELLHYGQLQALWNWLHQIIMGRPPLPSGPQMQERLPSRLTPHAFSNTRAIPPV